MPFKFYAEMSFTEICGRGYFGIRPHLQNLLSMSAAVQQQASSDGWYPVSPVAMSAMYPILS